MLRVFGLVQYGENESPSGSALGLERDISIPGTAIATAQRWAREGMPVEHSGRLVQAYPEKLNLWLGRETREPVQIATESPDLSPELRRGLAYVRDNRRRRKET